MASGGTGLPVLPNQLVLIQQLCINCHRLKNDHTAHVSLQRCGGCRRVSYCSVLCQREHWREHKSFCKAFSAIESDPSSRPILHVSLPDPDTPSEDLTALNSHAHMHSEHRAKMCQLYLKRMLTMVEGSLLAFDPRCLVCTRTDQDIRMEIAQGSLETTRVLRPCPDCTLTFFCCNEHHEFARNVHQEEQFEDGLSHCEMCKRIAHDIRVFPIMKTTPSWVPDRIKDRWRSLKDQTWESEYAGELAKVIGVRYPRPGAMEALLRFMTDKMTLAMTTLWALENLNDDDAWSRKRTLKVHILGASPEEEMEKSRVFEEIMHRLPDVETLVLAFIGPDFANLKSNPLGTDILIDDCAKCRQRGRKRIHYYYGEMYHEYVKAQGTEFVAPDLAIAFNSGAGVEQTVTWRPTIELLVREKIPSLFTSYDSDEAQLDSQALKDGGAHLLPALGPRRNPWASEYTRTQPHIVRGIFSHSRFIAGGFCD